MWTHRLSRAFLDNLRNEVSEAGERSYSDRTLARITAHLKTFPLGNPTGKLKTITLGTGLEIERAVTPAERRKLLDVANFLPVMGGRSRDRRRYGDKDRPDERPRRKSYRP